MQLEWTHRRGNLSGSFGKVFSPRQSGIWIGDGTDAPRPQGARGQASPTIDVSLSARSTRRILAVTRRGRPTSNR